MNQVLQLLLAGVAQGCVYALVALGFVLIYKATEVINFAQGELMMVGAFFAYTVVDLGGVPFVPGVLLALLATAAFGALLNHLLLRPLIGSPAFTIVLATVAVSTLLRAAVAMVPGWGVETHRLTSPLAGQVVPIGKLVVSAEHLMVIAVTMLLVGVLYLFFSRARVGVALQATSQNQLAAGYAGINIRRMFGLIWGISAAVAAIVVALLRTVYRVRAFGVHHVPVSGGALLVPNHVSMIDGLWVGAALPRLVYFLMHRDFIRAPVIGPFARMMGTIPVATGDSPEEKAESLRRAGERCANAGAAPNEPANMSAARAAVERRFISISLFEGARSKRGLCARLRSCPCAQKKSVTRLTRSKKCCAKVCQRSRARPARLPSAEREPCANQARRVGQRFHLAVGSGFDLNFFAEADDADGVIRRFVTADRFAQAPPRRVGAAAV